VSLVANVALYGGVRAVAAVPAIALVAGSALGLLCPGVPSSLLWAALIAGGACAIWYSIRGSAFGLITATALAFSAGGALLSEDAWHREWPSSLRATFDELERLQRDQAMARGEQVPLETSIHAVISGTLRADAAPSDSGVSLNIDVDRLESEARAVSGGAFVTVVGQLAAGQLDLWRAGRRVRAPAELRRPSRYLDAGVRDSERELARRGTSLVGTIKSGVLVDVVSRGGPIDEAMAAVRACARRAIQSAVGHWSSRSAAIVSAVVIGDRTALEPDVQRSLQEAGTYHVIAISGGNIAIVAGLLLGTFRLFGILGRAALVAAILAIVAYGELVGGGASVDRAALMAVVCFAGRLLDQRNPPLNALAFVGGCLVATSPLSVADPAFVLTFGATFVIVVVVPVVVQPLTDARAGGSVPTVRARALTAVVSLFAASMAAEAALFPVGAFVFSRVTFAGLLLNFLAIPLMAITQIAGMAVVPIALGSERAALACGYLAHLGAAGLVASAGLVRFVPVLTWRVAVPGWAAVVLYYVAALTWWVLWRRRSIVTGSLESCAARRVKIAAAAFAVGAGVWMVAQPWLLWRAGGHGTLHVVFLDVGQGDATFVRFPGSSTLLIDAGGTSGAFDVGDRVVAPVLRAEGVRRLDYLVLSHGDPDHIGGAPSIVREFRPLEILEGIPVARFDLLRALEEQARAGGLRWGSVKAGDRLTLDGTQVLVQHPPQPDWERQRVRNDDSVVLSLQWRDVSVLLTGDAGLEAEKAFEAALTSTPLRIMKAAHHGSRTSSGEEFVQRARPAVVIVSVGRANHFGHPAPEVLERYRQAGAEVLRTDCDGAITVDTDGYTVDIRTFAGRRLSFLAEEERSPRKHEGTKP
jgi:competence protein ComEC